MDYFTPCARALIQRAFALSKGGELLPQHLLLAASEEGWTSCFSERIVRTELEQQLELPEPQGEARLGNALLALFERAYLQARDGGSGRVSETDLLCSVDLPAVVNSSAAFEPPTSLAALLSGGTRNDLEEAGLDVAAVQHVLSSVTASMLNDSTEDVDKPLMDEIIQLVMDTGWRLYGRVAAFLPGSKPAVLCGSVGLTREFCLQRLRNHFRPARSPLQEKAFACLPDVAVARVPGASGEVALRLAWQLCGRSEIAPVHLLEALLSADRLVGREGGAETLLRRSGLWREVHSCVARAPGAGEERDGSAVRLSPASLQVMLRTIATSPPGGYETEHLLRELSHEADLWTELGLNPVRVRTLISEYWVQAR